MSSGTLGILSRALIALSRKGIAMQVANVEFEFFRNCSFAYASEGRGAINFISKLPFTKILPAPFVSIF